MKSMECRVCVTLHTLLLGEFRTEILELPAVETQPLAPRTVRYCPKEVAELWCSSSVQLPTLPRLYKEHRVPFPWVQTWGPRTDSRNSKGPSSSTPWQLCCRHREWKRFVNRIPKAGWQLHPVQQITSFISIFMSGMETVPQPSLVSSCTSTPSFLKTKDVFNIFILIWSSDFVSNKTTSETWKVESVS